MLLSLLSSLLSEPQIAHGVSKHYGVMLLQSFLALLAICLLAWLVLRWIAAGTHGAYPRAHLLKVIDTLVLGPRSRIHVVRSEHRAWLIGSGEQGQLQLLCELDPSEIPEQQASPSNRFAETLLKARSKLSEKKVDHT